MTGNRSAATIRIAGPGDAPAIAACARLAYAPYVAAIGREPAPMVADFATQIASGKVHVAVETDDALAGYVVCYPVDDAFQVENIAVMPDRAGHGIGRQLMAFAEETAARAGCAAVTLYTNIHMTRNLTFYPTLGYREVGRRTEDGFERVYYRKAI